MKLKFIFIAVISSLLSSVLSAEDSFEKSLEQYKNVTSESLLAEREKKQIAVILKENLDNTFLDGALVAVPGKSYSILKTEVTQEFYEFVMGENPSEFNGEKNLPVECVSWYDAVVFCNKLSVMDGLVPVYSVSNKTDVSEWDYVPHKGNSISKGVECNKYANGYRLPMLEEWQYAAKGGQEYEFSGSDNLSDVGWWQYNSKYKTHPVAQKKPNGYGLYDMSGNVWEWSDGGSNCGGGFKILYHGDYDEHTSGCGVNSKRNDVYRSSDVGFRIVRNIDE
ncbi:SUMF1/EgtB/PvdO family nonheme iron enzyme [uncultured Treponema sp.]|uniref:formylglycine-generating enzyme family protein n=1 Tax=uncultured Treponema sp. TaxID=162155 RepID=UPI0025CCCF46|nr:SUMF1/EgtB/PvdO family nonheme iron enzyme [uncultured Treponema sp.]